MQTDNDGECIIQRSFIIYWPTETFPLGHWPSEMCSKHCNKNLTQTSTNVIDVFVCLLFTQNVYTQQSERRERTATDALKGQGES